MLRASLIVLLALSAQPIAAQTWNCTMTTECFDTEACADTSYDFDFGTLQDRFLKSDIAGERPYTEQPAMEDPDFRAFASAVQNLSAELLTIYPDGRAHLSVHSPDYMLTYRGTCRSG